jgi:TonB family protein
MFAVLPASEAHLDLKLRWVTTSALSHALLVALAVGATRSALDAARIAPPDEEILLFVPRAPEPPPPAPARAEKPAPAVNLADPPPQGFQTVPPVTEIPTVIPPVDLDQRPFDPRDFTGRGVEGGVADGVVGGTGPVRVDEIYQATTNLPGFEPAMVLSQPTPEYPAALASVGIEGRVEVQFVVDTTGRVERSSIEVVKSTQKGFEAAAREAISGSLFRPARLSNVPVRQLTLQAIRFVAAH